MTTRLLAALAVTLCACGATPLEPPEADASVDAGAGPPYWFQCVNTLTCTKGEPTDVLADRYWCTDDEAAAKQREIDTPTADCKNNAQCSCEPHYCVTENEPCSKSAPGPTYWFECFETATCASDPPRDFGSGSFCAASEAGAKQMDADHSKYVCTVPGCTCETHYCSTKREPCTP